MNLNPYAMYANIGTNNNISPSDIPLPNGEPPPPIQQQPQQQQQQQFTLSFTAQPHQQQQQHLHHHQQQQQQQQHHNHHQQANNQQHQHSTLTYQQYRAPMSDQQQQHSAPIFGSATKPLSFGELAAKQSENVMTSTLQQYGPAISIPSPMRPTSPYMQQQQQHAGTNIMFTTGGSVHHPGPRFSSTVPQVPVYHLQQANAPLLLSRPAVISNLHTGFQNQHYHATNNSMSLNNTSSNVSSATPEAPMSPPLDSLNSTAQNNHKAASESSDANALAVAPVKETAREKVQNQLSSLRDETKTNSLNELIANTRALSAQYQDAQKERSVHERELNEAVRKAHGKNLDVDPIFLRKKTLLDMQDLICKDLNDGINYLKDQLKNKYDYTLGPLNSARPSISQPLQKRQRVKMSTAAPTTPLPKPPAESDKVDEKKFAFDLKDGNLWCKDCDLHYSELKDFFDHLHRREHLTRLKKPAHPPWRTTLEKLTRKKSYDCYKSICAKLSNKIKSPFTVQDIDSAINPALHNTDELKELNLKRERGILASDDLLFQLKGYQFLVPIAGFYCNLCNRALCDIQEAELHLKSYYHLSEHAKTIALDPVREKKFREELEKSRKKDETSLGKDRAAKQDREREWEREREKEREREIEREKDRERERARELEQRQSEQRRERERPKVAVLVQASKAPESSSSTSREKNDRSPPPQQSSRGGVSQYSARLPYKKPTSHIVDEHETVSDKFDKRDKTDQSVVAVKVDLLPLKRPKRKEAPEIIPITQNRPSAALKKLKSSRLPEPNGSRSDQRDRRVEEVAVDDDDTEEDAHILEAIRSIENSSPDEAATSPAVDANNNDGNKNDDTEIVDLTGEVHLSPDDPDSPFPGMDLVVTGNIHTDVLKSKQLAQPAFVVLNRINIDDYREMLNESSSLHTRILRTLTKKEPSQYNKDLDVVTEAEPTFFRPDGENVPVELDERSSDADEFRMEHLENFFCES